MEIHIGLAIFISFVLSTVSGQFFLPFNFNSNLGELLQKLQTLDRLYQGNGPTASSTLSPVYPSKNKQGKAYPSSFLKGVKPITPSRPRHRPHPAQWKPPPMPPSLPTNAQKPHTHPTPPPRPTTTPTTFTTTTTTTTTTPRPPPTLPPPIQIPIPNGIKDCYRWCPGPLTHDAQDEKRCPEAFNAVPVLACLVSLICYPARHAHSRACVLVSGKRCSLKLRSFETDVPFFKYAYAHSSSPGALIEAVFESTKGTTLPAPLGWDVSIPPEVVQLSLTLMRYSTPNRVLVVGVFTGLGVIGAATAINERGLVVGIEDPRHNHYWSLIGNKYAQQAGLMRRIQIRSEFAIPEALDQLSRSEPGSFDFVIMDDPMLENYLVEYERCLTLMRSGGMMLINDAYAFGEVLSSPRMRSSKGEIMDQLNRKTKTDPRVSSTFLPIGNGVLLILKK